MHAPSSLPRSTGHAIVCGYCRGIAQFVDLGAGLPVSPSVHQGVRAVIATARVAYVYIDAVVLSHARALLATNDGVIAVEADLRDPQAVLADRELRQVIDPAEPVCVILGAVLHFLDADAARRWPSDWRRNTPLGRSSATPARTSRRSSPSWNW